MCIYVSFDKVIKIKFKVNGERLFLVLFLVALHFRRYEKIYIYIYIASTSRIAILLVRSKCFSSQ